MQDNEPLLLADAEDSGVRPCQLLRQNTERELHSAERTTCYLQQGGQTSSGKRVTRKLLLACSLSFTFMIIEVIGGFYAGSIAIMSDAAHMLSDVLSFLISAYCTHLIAQRTSSSYSFGYHRAETIGALVSVLIVCVLTGSLVLEAVQRLINPSPIDGRLMFIIAVVGIAFNLLLLATLGHEHHHHLGGSCSHDHGSGGCGGHSHGHDHGHSHGAGGCGGHTHGHDHGHSHGSGGCGGHSHGHDHGHSHGAGGCGGHTPGHGHSHSHASGGCGGHAHGHGAAQGDGHAHQHGQDQGHSRSDSAHCAHSHGHAHDHSHEDGGCPGHTHNESAVPAVRSATASDAHGVSCNDAAAAPQSLDSHSTVRAIPGGIAVDITGVAALDVDESRVRARQAHNEDHQNQNMRGAVLHVMGDLVQSFGVALAGAILWATDGDKRWLWIDPFTTFMFAVGVIFVTKKLIVDVFRDLMECSPSDVDVASLMHSLEALPGVHAVHDLHVWSIGSGKNILTAHIDAADDQDPYVLLKELEDIVDARSISHSTLQICSGRLLAGKPAAAKTSGAGK